MKQQQAGQKTESKLLKIFFGRKTKMVAVGAGITVLLTATAGGCDNDKFTRDCHAKGGHVQSIGHRGKQCLPPSGGWN